MMWLVTVVSPSPTLNPAAPANTGDDIWDYGIEVRNPYKGFMEAFNREFASPPDPEPSESPTEVPGWYRDLMEQ